LEVVEVVGGMEIILFLLLTPLLLEVRGVATLVLEIMDTLEVLAVELQLITAM
jgi:hypothetical protein